MSLLLKALGATLLLGALQDEPKPELKWDVTPEDSFDFKWTYQFDRDHKAPIGQGNESKATRLQSLDKRVVEATVTVAENAGPEGNLIITLKKVSWEYKTPEYHITLAHLGTRKRNPTTARVRVLVKDDKKAGFSRAKQVQGVANAMADRMKSMIEGTYTIKVDTPNGEPKIMRNKTYARNSLFENMYIYSKPPKGSVTKGQKWRDPLTGVKMQAGLVQMKTIDYQVSALSKKGITVKAGFQVPIVKPPTVTDNNTTGNFAYAREYTFSPEGFLSGSKEGSTFTKKVTSKTKFFQEDLTEKLAQVLTLKKARKR